MKKVQSLFFFLFLPLITKAFVGEAIIDGIKYNIITKAQTAEVLANNYSGDIVIPASIEYENVVCSVTGIGNDAFQSCSSLTSVTIPNSVTSIGDFAFQNCSSLTTITIGNSVTSIGESAFNNCRGLTSVHISDIAAWCKIAFSNYSSNPLCYAQHLYLVEEEITDLVIPNSVTNIGFYAFYRCTALTSVTIPNSVTSIGNYAFYYCSGLTFITIPNSVMSIGREAFSSCSGLTSVTISNSVTSIGEGAFYGCSGLTSVTIPNSVNSIGEGAFSGCKSLAIVTIPNSVTNLVDVFSGCSGLTSVTIPNSVTSIGNSAFSGCTSLMTVKSYITEPFNISRFSEETYRNGTLYVPAETKDLYIRFDGWREFLKIEEMEKESAPNGQCATPNIMIAGKTFKFSCETPDAEFESILTTEEHFTGNELPMGNRETVYTLTVYATAPGYDRSEPAKMSFTIDRTDVNKDGVVDVADIATIISEMAANTKREQ